MIIIILILKVDTTKIDCESPFDEVTVPGTTIISQNYPNAYDISTDCQLTIKFATNAIVSITFEDFYVESCWMCNCDYLAVHDGNSISSPIIGLKDNDQRRKGLCGYSPKGTTINSTGNVMTLHFFSDSRSPKTGFKIYADAIIGKSTFFNASGITIVHNLILYSLSLISIL